MSIRDGIKRVRHWTPIWVVVCGGLTVRAGIIMIRLAGVEMRKRGYCVGIAASIHVRDRVGNRICVSAARARCSREVDIGVILWTKASSSSGVCGESVYVVVVCV